MQVLKYFDVLVDHMQSVMYSADVSFTLLQDMVCDCSLWSVTPKPKYWQQPFKWMTASLNVNKYIHTSVVLERSCACNKR